MNNLSFDNIVKQLSEYKQKLELLRDAVLSNLVMISEVPSPTFGEAKRIKILQERFSEHVMENISVDEAGNGFGVLPGERRDNNILIVAHADTVFNETVDHTLTIDQDKVVGAGVADNSLGLATLISLPMLFEKLGIRLKSNLILMGASRSLGRGNLEGIRFFLKNNALPLTAGVCVEGVQLGHFGISATGMLRGEINCDVIEGQNGSMRNITGAIVALNEIINKMLRIPLPSCPRTSLIIGSIHSGASYNTIPHHGALQFEVLSESAQIVNDIGLQIEDFVAEVASRNLVDLSFEVIAQRQPGGISFSHPLARRTRQIMRALSINRIVEAPSISELSALIDHNIPAVRIGITSGENIREPNETISLDSISSGLAQLIGVIMAIDGGYCSEDNQDVNKINS